METVFGTRGEGDTMSSFPRVEQVAAELRVSTDILRGAFLNQGIWLNVGDRTPWPAVVDVLAAELAAGRPVVPAPDARKW